jgi:glycerophosphoryl diester phosphodiesterase
VPGLLEAHVRLALTLVLVLVVAWFAVETAISAIALGALAILLDARFEEPARPRAREDGPARHLSLRAVLAGFLALAVLGNGAGGAMLAAASRPDGAVAVIGHRGAAGTRPENTLASIAQAVEDGADWVEIDVQATADGEVVVVHDRDFMKLAGVDLRVRDATLADLAGIDVGGWFDPAYAGERTPTLAQALEAVRGRARLLIELKYYGEDPTLAARVAEIVDRAGMGGEVAVMSLSYPAAVSMRRLRPEWRVGVLAATSVGEIARLEGDFVAVNAASVTPRLARAAAAAGKDLYAWTVNDPLRMSALVSMGVDGLITDEPGLARETLETRAGLGAPGRLLLVVAERLGVSLPAKASRDASP